ncbi:MAG: DUF262 domain-containing protein [Bdellovibrionota bacterium]
MKISSLDREVRALLEAGYYKIPRFQRPYSWTRENVEDFWKDSILSLDQEYFIGSMVVFKEKDNYFGVVDGQQRLTTITIVLASLRNFFNEYKMKDPAEGVHSLIERKNIDNKFEYVIQTETSYPYFHEHIQKNGTPSTEAKGGEEEQALKNAFDQIKALLVEKLSEIEKSSANEKEKMESIEAELKRIRDKTLRLKLILIELDNEDDAYVIFETLNSRGKDLQVSDLIKNHLAKMCKRKNTGVDIARDKWRKIVETIDTSKADLDLNDFILHFWLSKYDYTTLKELFKKFKPKVEESNAQAFLDELQKEVKYYRAIDETDSMKWDKQELPIKLSLDALVLFKVRQPKPALLSTLSVYKGKILKLTEATELISAIEKFHFLSTAITSQRSSGGVSKMYALIGRTIRSETDATKRSNAIRQFKEKLRKAKPNRDEFILSFSELKYSELYTKSKKLIQYILEKNDALHRGGTPIDYNQMTIEHILPQSSAKNDTETGLVANIGNLIFVPTTLNAALDDKPFPEKKRLLIQSKHPVDKVLNDATTWDEKQILERAKHLAGEAFDPIWSF